MLRSNHFISQPATKIECLTAPGVGRNHTWMVSHLITLSDESASELAGASSLASTDQTSYSSPTLRSVEPSYAFTDDCPTRTALADAAESQEEGPGNVEDGKCVGPPGFGTRGGENVTLAGRDFGPLGTVVSAFYRTGNNGDAGASGFYGGPTLAESDISATDCRVTVANREVGCERVKKKDG